MPRNYLSINLTKEQQDFIQLLDDYEIDIFTGSDVENQLNKKFVSLLMKHKLKYNLIRIFMNQTNFKSRGTHASIKRFQTQNPNFESANSVRRVGHT